jgi:hypothetical protein
VFENRVLRRTVPKRDDMTGGWKELHDEEFHNLYSLPHAIRTIKARRMGWANNAARMGAKKKACRLMVGKANGKRPLGRPGYRSG